MSLRNTCELVETIRENHDRFPDLKVHEKLVLKRFFADIDFEVELFEWRLWVTESSTDSLITAAHQPKICGHGVARLCQMFYWPGMVV